MKNKDQHFVPQSYLQAWTDPQTPDKQTPYLWIFDKDGSNPRNKAPHNIFSETDFYTITKADGERDLVLEHGLAQLESEFVKIRDNTLGLHQPLQRAEHIYLCAFVAAMHARTAGFREFQQEQWGEMQQIMGKMIEWEKTATPEEKENALTVSSFREPGRGLSYEQVKELAKKPVQTFLPIIVKQLTPLLLQIDFLVLCTSDEIGFITSDQPCVWFDSEAYKRHPMYRAPGLAYESIEIRLPVSPRQLICLNRKGLNGYLDLDKMITGGEILDEINRTTRAYAHEHFVVNRKQTKEIWFHMGEMPKDSWEALNAEPENRSPD